MALSKEDKEKLIRFCKKYRIGHKTGWENFTGNISLPHTVVLDIQSEDQAVALAKFIYELNKEKEIDDIITYRASAAGENKEHPNKRYDCQSYSMTPCMEADILLHLRGDQFHAIRLLDRTRNIVSVGPSIQMGHLDERLYKDFNLVLPTSTLIPWVTIGGSATGTHGTGRDQPSIAGLIRKMRILRPNGSIILLDHKHDDFETIRAAHLGLFGIVLEMDIKTRPAMNLEVTTITTNVHGYKELIQKGLYKDNEYVSVAYFADGEQDEGAKNASDDLVIMTWKPVPLSTPLKGNCSQLKYLGQRMTIALQEGLHINALLKMYPQAVAPFKKYLVAPAMKQNDTVVVPWPDGAHYQRAFPHDLDDEDDLFPVSADCHELLDALDHMVATLNKHTAKGLNPSLYAMYFRYFKGTNGGLSTSAHGKNQHVVGFDMTSARNMPGFDEFKADIRNYLIEKYGAKPHHGKTVPADMSYETLYGKGYIDFKKALTRWMKECGLTLERNPHLNSFFRHHLEIGPVELRVRDAITMQKREAPAISTAKLIEEVLQFLQANDEEFKTEESAQALQKKLMRLLGEQKPSITKTPSAFYYPSEQSPVESELTSMERSRKMKKCGGCAIL